MWQWQFQRDPGPATPSFYIQVSTIRRRWSTARASAIPAQTSGKAMRRNCHSGHTPAIVFNGVSLMHILDHQTAIAEAAAGAPGNDQSVEICLWCARGRDELYDCFRRNDLAVVRRWIGIAYDLAAVLDGPDNQRDDLAMCEGSATPEAKEV